MNTADILDRAADLIEERGLAKRRHVTMRGCLCASGAMFAAAGIEPRPGVASPESWPTWSEEAADVTMLAYEWFGDWLKRSGFKDDADAVQWNDRKVRTKEEVVSTLRAAAQAARAER